MRQGTLGVGHYAPEASRRAEPSSQGLQDLLDFMDGIHRIFKKSISFNPKHIELLGLQSFLFDLTSNWMVYLDTSQDSEASFDPSQNIRVPILGGRCTPTSEGNVSLKKVSQKWGLYIIRTPASSINDVRKGWS